MLRISRCIDDEFISGVSYSGNTLALGAKNGVSITPTPTKFMKKKQLPKSYFVETLLLMANMGKPGYDGYNPKSAEAMRTLVDSLVESAKDALDGKPLYYGSYKNGKDKPIWAPLTTGGKFKIYPTE